MSADDPITQAERRLQKRRSRMKRPERAGSSIPDLPNRPQFAACAGCRERFTNLPPNGYCWDCQPTQPLVAVDSRSRALRRANVPSRFRDMDFVDPASWPKPAGEDTPIDSWSGDPELLTLQGGTDTGKTTLAVELLWQQRGSRLWVVAGDVPDLKIRGEPGRWEELFDADVLLIDELGRGHNRDGWEFIYRVISERWNWRRPTITTTNLAAADLKSAHPPLYRRLRDSWFVPLTKRWTDRLPEGSRHA